MVAKKIATKLHGRLLERPHLIPSPETGDTSTKGPHEIWHLSAFGLFGLTAVAQQWQVAYYQ